MQSRVKTVRVLLPSHLHTLVHSGLLVVVLDLLLQLSLGLQQLRLESLNLGQLGLHRAQVRLGRLLRGLQLLLK